MEKSKFEIIRELVNFYNEKLYIPSAQMIASMYNIGAKKAYWIHGYLTAMLNDDRYIREIEESEDQKTEFIEVVFADMHIPYIDEKAFFTAIDFCKNLPGVDKFVLLGDEIDFYQISFWNRNPKKMSIEEEIEMCKDYLKLLKKEFSDADFYMIESNHHLRLQRYIFSNAPELAGLRQLMFENLLDLNSLGIKYISNEKLISITGKPFKIGGLYHIHGHEVKTGGINVARNVYLKTQQNVIMGHFHRTQEYIHRTLDGRVYGCWSVGCLCQLTAEYAPVNQWNHGFAVIYHFDSEYFEVKNYKIINGKVL